MEGEKKNRQESVGSVDINSEGLENSKEVERKAQVTQGLSKYCTSRESVSPLSRLISRFRNNKYNRSPHGRISTSGIE